MFLTGSQLPSYDHFKHWVLANGWMEEGKPLAVQVMEAQSRDQDHRVPEKT